MRAVREGMKLQQVMTIAALTALVVSGQSKMDKISSGPQTVRNLQSAFNGESNAQARYLAFAKRADQEGRGPAASLFRAVARAEEIHLTNHAAVLRGMGATPELKMDKVAVHSTRVNLGGAASKGEAYERDTMYPKFIATAKSEANPEAVTSFEYAQKAEAQHYALFQSALKNVGKMSANHQDYFVCKVSGYTSLTQDAAMCAGSSYETVN